MVRFYCIYNFLVTSGVSFYLFNVEFLLRINAKKKSYAGSNGIQKIIKFKKFQFSGSGLYDGMGSIICTWLSAKSRGCFQCARTLHDQVF